MLPVHTLQLGLILLLSAFVTGSAGFGFALCAVPLLWMAGLSLPQSIAVCATTTAFQGTASAFHFRRHIPWRPVWPVLVTVGLTVPLGTLALRGLAELNQGSLRVIVGATLLVVLAAMWWLKPAPRDRLATGWGVLAGGCCGLLAGMVGTGGPPVVLWVMAHRWTNRQSRVALWMIFLATVPFQLFWLCLTFGWPIAEGVKIGLLGLPVVLVGLAAGIYTGNRFSRERLRQVATVLLVLTAMSMIVQGAGAWAAGPLP